MRTVKLPLVLAAAWVIGSLMTVHVAAIAEEPESQLRVLKGHTDKVTSLSLSADGTRLLSGGDDKTVRLWDVKTGKELLVLEGHTNFVLSVAISSDGTRALSGSGGEFQGGRFTPGSDRSLRLWDLETGKELRKISHLAPVWSVRFLPGGQGLSATGDSDFSLRVWDWTLGKEIRRLGKKHSGQGVSLSADGTRVLAAAASPDLIPKLWNVETGEEVQRFEGHQAVVRGSALSADGRYALTAGGNFVPGGLDTAVRLWDVESGREVRRMEGHKELVWCVAISSDRRRALSGGVDGTIRLWDVESGKELAQLKGHEVVENDPRVGNRADVRAVLFLPGDQQAVSAGHDRTIRIWNLP